MSYSDLDSTLLCKCSLLQCKHTLPTVMRASRSTFDVGKNIFEKRGCALKELELCERRQRRAARDRIRVAHPLPVFLEAGSLEPSPSRRYAEVVALDVILGYLFVIFT